MAIKYKEEEMPVKYSVQGKVMLENIKDFDKEEFERWFFRNLEIGSNNILEYLMRRGKPK